MFAEIASSEAIFDCPRETESSLKTELPKEVKVEKRRSLFDYQASKGSEGEEEDLSSSPIKILAIINC